MTPVNMIFRNIWANALFGRDWNKLPKWARDQLEPHWKIKERAQHLLTMEAIEVGKKLTPKRKKPIKGSIFPPSSVKSQN